MGKDILHIYTRVSTKGQTTSYSLDDQKRLGIEKSKHRSYRVLPKNMNQVTEIVLFDYKAAVFVYSSIPTVVLIEYKYVFDTFRKHFDLLWNMSN